MLRLAFYLFLITAGLAASAGVIELREPGEKDERSSDSFEKCAMGKEQTKKAAERLRATFKDAGDECFRKLEEEINKCVEEAGGADCKAGREKPEDEAAKANPGKGVPGAADAGVRKLLKGANCASAKENCLARKQKRVRKELEAICGKDAKDKSHEFTKVFADGRNCLGYQYDDLKREAKVTLQDSLPGRADGSSPQIQCIKEGGEGGLEACYLTGTGSPEDPKIECLIHDRGNQVCRVNNGSTEFKQLNEKDPEEVSATGLSPGRMALDAGSHCSGSVLGDGETFVTAGHCTNSRTDGSAFQASVFDKDGVKHDVTVTCNSGSFNTYADVNTCKLASPIEAQPVYQMVRNNTIGECQKQGWTWMCPDSELRKMANQPATILGYPGTYSLSMSQGYIRYDEATGTFNHQMSTTGGSSGSGIVIDFRGDRTIVSAVSTADRAGFAGTGVVPTFDLLGDKIHLPYITQALRDGEPLFREIDLIHRGD